MCALRLPHEQIEELNEQNASKRQLIVFVWLRSCDAQILQMSAQRPAMRKREEITAGELQYERILKNRKCKQLRKLDQVGDGISFRLVSLGNKITNQRAPCRLQC